MENKRKYEYNNGFIVPENYFETSRHRFQNQISENGFKVPSGYFETARTKLEIHFQPKPAHRLFTINKWWYAAAASFILAALSIYVTSVRQVHAPGLSELSTEEIFNYVASDVNVIPVSELGDASLFDNNEHEEEMINQIDEELLLNEL